MPQPFLGFSLQSVPLAGIARPSRGHMLPCGHPPACDDAATRSVHRRFPRRPRLPAWLPDSPDDYGLPFSAPRRASRSPRGRAAEPPRSASFTRFEALILLRVRSRRRESPRAAGRSSPGLFLSEVFSSHASALGPAQATRACACPFARGLRGTARGTVTPLQPGETNPTQKHRVDLVGGFRSPSRPARAASRRRSSSHGLGAPGEPFAPDLRSLEVRGKRRVSEEIASSSEVSRLLASLVTVEPPQVRAYGFTSGSGSRLRSPSPSLDLDQPLPEGHVAAVSAAGSEPLLA